MFRTLYSKLALTLFVLVGFLGLIWFQGLSYTSDMYQQEVSQKLNLELAKHIVAETEFFKSDQVNNEELEHLFHSLMVINPAIEVYLLDPSGKVLVYFAPEGKVKVDTIDLKPIKKFITSKFDSLVLGTNPRNPQKQNVFSAAEISQNDQLKGYLYIILGSEKFESVMQQFKASYILQNSVTGLLLSFILILAMGFVAFAFLTRKIRNLTRLMGDFVKSEYTYSDTVLYRNNSKYTDEIDELGEQYNHMVSRIQHQFDELNKKDNLRRELVANVSHDLRTPIASLMGYLETLGLKKDSLSKEQYDEYLKVALDQGNRLGQLVDELFELAKLDSCESVVYSEPFSLADLINDVVQKFTLRAAEKKINLSISCKIPGVWVYGDIAMIQRVLENLVENAIRNTSPQGEIVLGITTDDKQATVTVKDSGRGIPEDEIPHIFERFYQVDKSRTKGLQGSGLGLAISKRILELHGSDIAVESKLDDGTVFSFPMPVYSKIIFRDKNVKSL